jgi:hypothetical protein
MVAPLVSLPYFGINFKGPKNGKIEENLSLIGREYWERSP